MQKYLKQIKPVYLRATGLVVVIIIVVLVAVFSGKGGDKKNSNFVRPAGQTFANLSIGGNGEVRISGLMITQNSWGTIIATSTINTKSIGFVIKTNSSTVVHKGTTVSSVGDLAQGEIIMVVGTLENFGETLTLTAKDIRTFGGFAPPQGLPANTTIKNPITTKIATTTKATTTIQKINTSTSTKKTTTIKK